VNSTDALGYVAATLVLATFYMTDMTSLRITAIASNIAFIGYGYVAGIEPVLLLHALLLPMNTIRALQWYQARPKRS
jgi:CRP/FNR family transcriptional regulator, cyclic AMP receptor protein